MESPYEDSPIGTYRTIAVIGAAGKMGSGIALLLLQEMTLCRIAETNPQNYYLTLIDADSEKLDGLRKYLQTQLQKWAEKNIITLRKTVEHIPSLISNREIIEAFLANSMEIAHFASGLEAAKHSLLIFEAIVENIESKVKLFSTLKGLSLSTPYFFSNTSSIPISDMNEKASLGGRIIGFHLYNPPAIQKLIEIIPLENGDPFLRKLAIRIAEKLNKEVILSRDVAGFIGNGYFLREISYACQIAKELEPQHGLVQSLYIVNRVTQDFLLRPMGIFQLVDYVGLDVVANISIIMNQFLKYPISPGELFKPLFDSGKIGGQNSDGSQKTGLFQYESNQIRSIYDPKAHSYCLLETAAWKKKCDAWLGNPPGDFSWKSLSKDPQNKNKISAYFDLLSQESTPGALLALKFIHHLHQICLNLVRDGIASSIEDVNIVLEKGFYHLYSSADALENASDYHPENLSISTSKNSA
jgi:3-hydroxyacyl-CoA dehydrogenase